MTYAADKRLLTARLKSGWSRGLSQEDSVRLFNAFMAKKEAARERLRQKERRYAESIGEGRFVIEGIYFDGTRVRIEEAAPERRLRIREIRERGRTFWVKLILCKDWHVVETEDRRGLRFGSAEAALCAVELLTNGELAGCVKTPRQAIGDAEMG